MLGSRQIEKWFRRREPVSFPPVPPPLPTGVTILERRAGHLELTENAGASLTLVHVTDHRNGTWEALHQRFVLMSLMSPNRRQGSATRLLAYAQKFADVRGLAIELVAEPADRRTDRAWLEQFYRSRGFSPANKMDRKGRGILRYEPVRPIVLDWLENGELMMEDGKTPFCLRLCLFARKLRDKCGFNL